MASYILADPKFFSKKAAQEADLTEEEYNELLITNCNKILTENDSLYLMGQITFGTLEETGSLLERIKCKKIEIMDFCEKDFSKTDWNKIGVKTISNTNGMIDGIIDKKKQKVIILCNLHSLAENVSNYYCAAAFSFPVRKKWFSNRILNLSTEYWDYYPVNYEKIPNLIQEKIINGG